MEDERRREATPDTPAPETPGIVDPSDQTDDQVQLNEDAQKDTSPAQPVDASPESAVPPSETPATPAHEEADNASGQPDESSDDGNPHSPEPDGGE